MELSIDDNNHSLTWFEYVVGFDKVGHILSGYVTSNDGNTIIMSTVVLQANKCKNSILSHCQIVMP